ncbi:MAG: cheB 1 [Flavipsychrobacter sp.]|jgi:CheY-like chemotaxis protein|nr:cheB 1 [Flavipsychrobacter sp.]
MQVYKYEKVLIVDDTALDCFIAEKVMHHAKFAKNTICIASATDALKYLETLTDNSDSLPDLIFLDVNMPGMNGFQFLSAYKQLPGAAKRKSIIMLTSSVFDEEKKLALSNEYVRSFINKPLNADDLVGL